MWLGGGEVGTKCCGWKFWLLGCGFVDFGFGNVALEVWLGGDGRWDIV